MAVHWEEGDCSMYLAGQRMMNAKSPGKLLRDSVTVAKPMTVSGDDHLSLIRRAVPGCDIIDFDIALTDWHTPQDTLDRVELRSLATAGYVRSRHCLS